MDAAAIAYSMLTESYNKIRTICERYNVAVEVEETYMRPTGAAFHRDAFPTPEVDTVTGYGVIADTNINMTGGLSNILEEPDPEAKDLSVARSLLYTADLPMPAPPPDNEIPDTFQDLIDPAEDEVAEAQESTRITANEQVLVHNPDLLTSLQSEDPVLDDVHSLIISNPNLFSNFTEHEGVDSSHTVHLKSSQEELTGGPPGARLGTPVRKPVDSM